MALFEEISADQCQTKRKENQDMNQLTETATLKIEEANKIRELYKIIGEFTESEKGKQLGERQKVEEEWKEMEEINNSLNVNQTDQLEALRYKMKAKNHNLSKEKSEQIMENEMPGMRKEIPKKKHKINTEMQQEELGLGLLGENGTFVRVHFSEIPEGGVADRRTFCVYYQKQTNN